MSTVPPAAPGFHDDPVPAGCHCRLRGHPDEAAALLADPDHTMTPADVAKGLEHYEMDLAVQRADEAAVAEMAEALRRAKELFGITVSIRVTRMLSVDAATGTTCGYTACLIKGADVVVGEGASPDLAVERLAKQVDRRITPAFGGHRVPGVCLVLAAPHRTAEDARAFARRVAVDLAYLDTLLGFRTPGVYDERPRGEAVAEAA